MTNKNAKADPGGEITSEELNAAEKILLLLTQADRKKPIPGNLWLQKELFVVARDLDPLQDYLDFEPHLQGPFSETVDNMSENLQYLGLIEKNRRGHRLTEKGERLTKSIEDGTSEDILKLIGDTKIKLNDLSKDELLVYIYYSHPEMTTQSLEKENLEKKRPKLAEKLYKRKKVDLSKAAQLAGMEVESFKVRVS